MYESWVDYMYNVIFDCMVVGVFVMDGVYDMLDWLEVVGKKVVVVLNGLMGKMECLFGFFGFFECLFGCIYLVYDYGILKLEFGFLFKVVVDVGVLLDRVLMVDDSFVGVWVVCDVGMWFFGYVEYGNVVKMKNEGVVFVYLMVDFKCELG